MPQRRCARPAELFFTAVRAAGLAPLATDHALNAKLTEALNTLAPMQQGDPAAVGGHNGADDLPAASNDAQDSHEQRSLDRELDRLIDDTHRRL